MKKLLTDRNSFFDFLSGKPPYQTSWEGYELSGKKNPQSIVDLFGLLNQIDLVAALANREDKEIPEAKKQKLEKEFFNQIEKIYEEFKDSSSKMNIKTPAKLSEETTQVYKFFLDLKEDRYAFQNFIRDLNSKVINNDTERAIRVVKSVMKVVGTFRDYSREYADLESYVSSSKKQKLNLQQALEELVNGNTNFLFDQKPTVSKPKRGIIKTVPVKKEKRKILIIKNRIVFELQEVYSS